MIKRIAIYLALAALLFVGADRALTQTETVSFGIEVIFPIEPISLTGDFMDATWHNIIWGDSGVLSEDGADYFRDLNVNIGGYPSADLSYMVSPVAGLPDGFTNLIKAHGEPSGKLFPYNGQATPAGGMSSSLINFTASSTEFYNLVFVTVEGIQAGTYSQVFTWTLTAN